VHMLDLPLGNATPDSDINAASLEQRGWPLRAFYWARRV